MSVEAMNAVSACPLSAVEPRGDPLHRALALARILDHQGAPGQVGEVLARCADDHDRAVRRAGHDAGRPAQQGRPVPLQGRLGRAHPRGPAARQHNSRGNRHVLIVGGRKREDARSRRAPRRSPRRA